MYDLWKSLTEVVKMQVEFNEKVKKGYHLFILMNDRKNVLHLKITSELCSHGTDILRTCVITILSIARQRSGSNQPKTVRHALDNLEYTNHCEPPQRLETANSEILVVEHVQVKRRSVKTAVVLTSHGRGFPRAMIDRASPSEWRRASRHKLDCLKLTPTYYDLPKNGLNGDCARDTDTSERKNVDTVVVLPADTRDQMLSATFDFPDVSFEDSLEDSAWNWNRWFRSNLFDGLYSNLQGTLTEAFLQNYLADLNLGRLLLFKKKPDARQTATKQKLLRRLLCMAAS
ncbi:Icarapin-like [Melipona quadrifasciata]|uniref:Icarapin-like n=1 Tax=Melipona quadrifasciata TaxID=166423 RepID=A0A0M9AAW6_9HYME|nr:Icarapin-like [Melipona quadrifasciata]